MVARSAHNNFAIAEYYNRRHRRIGTGPFHLHFILNKADVPQIYDYQKRFIIYAIILISKMTFMKRKYFILLTIIITCGIPSRAQLILPKHPMVLNFDYSRFKLSSDTAYFELSYIVYSSNVTLERFKDTLRGAVLLQTQIFDKKKDSLIINSSAWAPFVIADIAAPMLDYIGKSIYALPQGSYYIIIREYDRRNPLRKDSVRKSFNIEPFNKSPMISDLELCSKIIQSDNKKSPFYKNTYEVVPNPNLVFGGKGLPVVFSYAELYNLNKDSTYIIITGLIDGKGKYVKQKKQVHRNSSSNVVEINSLNIYPFQSNKYRFVLIITDTLGKELARSEKPVYLYNPHVETTNAGILSEKSVELAGLSDDELISEFRKIKYIVTDQMIKTFNKITSSEGRRECLAKFWAEIETEQREGTVLTRATYLDRIQTANQRYHVMGRDGWLTDRGRIYLVYAEPDEIERFPNSSGSKPYEIWHYNQIESGVIFVFIDRSGFGDYSLVNSTKRGEIQDDSWQQYLQ